MGVTATDARKVAGNNGTGNSYRVKRGDSLSSIALQRLGSESLWTEISHLNQLPNGNLVLVGQALKMPVRPTTGGKAKVALVPAKQKPAKSLPYAYAPAGAHRAPPSHHVRSTTPRAVPVLYPAVKYTFDKCPPMEADLGSIEVKLKWVGELTVQRKGVLTEIELTSSKKLSGKLKAEYDSDIGKIAGSYKIKFDSKTPNKAEASCGFTLTSKVDGQDFVSHDVSFTPPNIYKYKLKPRDVSGEVHGLIFKGNLGFELEVKLKSKQDTKKDIPEGVWLAASCLCLMGAAIIVVDIAKDVATLGVGAVESPLSFAAAATLFTQAGAMMH